MSATTMAANGTTKIFTNAVEKLSAATAIHSKRRAGLGTCDPGLTAREGHV
jgi:hypothetical protein